LRSNTNNKAFTILEVLAAALILVILLLLFVPNLRNFIYRSGEAACMANMRSINLGLHGYLQDHQNMWPQGPSPVETQPWETFWLGVLEKYGITPKIWQCPTCVSQMAAQGVPKDERPKVHYVPTTFSAEPGIANRWATQPWLIEKVSVHPNGPHICFPDGSIKSFNKVLAEQGVR
jgi:type II secretory pathway pseudopilin PulG